MPLVAFSSLPTFERLKNEQHDVLTLETAMHQDIRELHVGLLNMMPDAALHATERQFMRLLGDSNQIVQIYVHLFTLPSIKRDEETQQWIKDYYEDFHQIKNHGLDALIITGAQPQKSCLEAEDFWPELIQVIDWASRKVTSVLCACLASHAVLQYLYGLKKQPMRAKQWGIFEHRITDVSHPLTRHINSRFDVPHSRFNQITQTQLNSVNCIALACSEEAGLHLAVSQDGIRFVFFQGHPEYDLASLLKEYKREIDAWCDGLRDDYPPMPQNYFNPAATHLLQQYQSELVERANQNSLAKDKRCSLKSMVMWPEQDLIKLLDNTWRDTTLSIFSNWLGLVYRLTHKDLNQPFMSHIDPNDPLKALC